MDHSLQPFSVVVFHQGVLAVPTDEYAPKKRICMYMLGVIDAIYTQATELPTTDDIACSLS